MEFPEVLSPHIAGGGGYDPHNQLVTRTPLGATKNCIMKKVVFFIATAFLLALASSLCVAKDDVYVYGNVKNKFGGGGIPEATVKLWGTDCSTKTDARGLYEMYLPSWKKFKVLIASKAGFDSDWHYYSELTNFVLIAIGPLADLVSDLLLEGFGPGGVTSLD